MLKTINSSKTARSRQKKIFTDENGEKFIIEKANTNIQRHYLLRAKNGAEYYKKLECTLKSPIGSDLQFEGEKWYKTEYLNNAKWERSITKAQKYLKEISLKGVLITLSEKEIDEITERFLDSYPEAFHYKIRNTKEYKDFQGALFANVGQEINLVYEHGDFTTNNLLSFRNENYLIDFEFHRLSQPEGFDLFDFSKSIGVKPSLISNRDINVTKYQLIAVANALVDECIEKIELTDADWKNWKLLYLEHGDDYSQNPEWIRIWANNFATPGQILRPMVNIQNEGAITVYPFIQSQNELYPAGIRPDFIDQFVPLTHPGQNAKSIIEFIKYSKKLLTLKYVSTANTVIADLIRRADADPQITILIDYIDVRPQLLLEKYFPSKKIKSDIKRLYNRSKLYSERGFCFSIKVDLALEDVRVMLDVHEERWGKRVYTDRRQMEKFIYDLWNANLLIIAELILADETIAYQICHVAGDKVTSWLPIYDPKYKQISPGKYIQHELINWCCLQNFTVFDFGRGIESYKFIYANSSEVLYNISIMDTGFSKKRILTYIKKISFKLTTIFLKLRGGK